MFSAAVSAATVINRVLSFWWAAPPQVVENQEKPGATDIRGFVTPTLSNEIDNEKRFFFNVLQLMKDFKRGKKSFKKVKIIYFLMTPTFKETGLFSYHWN